MRERTREVLSGGDPATETPCGDPAFMKPVNKSRVGFLVCQSIIFILYAMLMYCIEEGWRGFAGEALIAGVVGVFRVWKAFR